jgi:hypothetical protein
MTSSTFARFSLSPSVDLHVPHHHRERSGVRAPSSYESRRNRDLQRDRGLSSRSTCTAVLAGQLRAPPHTSPRERRHGLSSCLRALHDPRCHVPADIGYSQSQGAARARSRVHARVRACCGSIQTATAYRTQGPAATVCLHRLVTE